MKKQRKSNQPRKKNKDTAAVQVQPTRRSFMTNAPYIIGGIIAAGGLGYLGISTVRADLAEQDLSVIGTGVPVIVQVHDPSCPICLALQKEARAAMDMVEDDRLEYRVASITSDVGREFATAHGSSHATLLFMDNAGNVVQRVQAPSDRDTLKTAFDAHIAANN